MNEDLKKIIKKEIEKTPKEISEVLESFKWIEITERIGLKYKLIDEEISSLQIETLLVLTRLNDLNSYSSSIEEEIGLTKEESINIEKEMIEFVFNPIALLIKEKIKTKISNQNTNYNQNLNFILSGGDYSYFLEDSTDTTEEVENINTKDNLKTNSIPVKIINTPSLADIKNNLQKNTQNQTNLKDNLVI